MPRDFTPTRPVSFEELHNLHVFVQAPLLLDDLWVQMVVPPLSALLANAPRETHGDLSPVLRTVGCHNPRQKFVLTLGPRDTDHVTPIAELQVAFMALYFRLVHDFADPIPGVLAVLLYQGPQAQVLCTKQSETLFALRLTYLMLVEA